MKMTHLWKLYEADKRILGFSPHTLKAYSLQFKVLVREIGNLNISEVTLDLLKEYLARQSERLKPNSMGHRIRFIRSLFRFAFEERHIANNPTTKLKEPKVAAPRLCMVKALSSGKCILQLNARSG
ncbi:phage integrase SAM-like domain-containing protein [Paenibacillus antri]|uniref:phage integrase SAM-like domain-containing protein n=1 Tax=Paenibacillus antri TaxID=2582848 RepID=UPI0026B40895